MAQTPAGVRFTRWVSLGIVLGVLAGLGIGVLTQAALPEGAYVDPTPTAGFLGFLGGMIGSLLWLARSVGPLLLRFMRSVVAMADHREGAAHGPAGSAGEELAQAGGNWLEQLKRALLWTGVFTGLGMAAGAIVGCVLGVLVPGLSAAMLGPENAGDPVVSATGLGMLNGVFMGFWGGVLLLGIHVYTRWSVRR